MILLIIATVMVIHKVLQLLKEVKKITRLHQKCHLSYLPLEQLEIEVQCFFGGF